MVRHIIRTAGLLEFVHRLPSFQQKRTHDLFQTIKSEVIEQFEEPLLINHESFPEA